MELPLTTDIHEIESHALIMPLATGYPKCLALEATPASLVQREESATFTWHQDNTSNSDLSSESATDYSSPSDSTTSTTMTSPTLAATQALNTTQHAEISRLVNLPNEILFSIFSHLDLIDSTCLAISHPHLYLLHRSLFPFPVPLNTRRKGPNLLEQAWEVIQGTQRCLHCGVYFCLLHRHVANWMAKGEESGAQVEGDTMDLKWELEPPSLDTSSSKGSKGRLLDYCPVRGKFGRKGEGEKICFRRYPPLPGICGRHKSDKDLEILEQWKRDELINGPSVAGYAARL